MHLLQRIGCVVVFVTKWDEAMRFYADVLGIEVVQRRDEEGFARFRFPQAGPDLLIEQVDNPEAVQAHDLVGHFVGMSVTVGDIGEAYERLSEKGVRFEGPPSRQSWGEMLTHFYDPDGNMWSLVEATGANT